jgi:hypothetical protein
MILEEKEWRWRGLQVVHHASASCQLMFFVSGAKGTGISLWLVDGTFVPEGFALTHSHGEVVVFGTRGFIGMLFEIG